MWQGGWTVKVIVCFGVFGIQSFKDKSLSLISRYKRMTRSEYMVSGAQACHCLKENGSCQVPPSLSLEWKELYSVIGKSQEKLQWLGTCLRWRDMLCCGWWWCGLSSKFKHHSSLGHYWDSDEVGMLNESHFVTDPTGKWFFWCFQPLCCSRCSDWQLLCTLRKGCMLRTISSTVTMENFKLISSNMKSAMGPICCMYGGCPQFRSVLIFRSYCSRFPTMNINV